MLTNFFRNDGFGAQYQNIIYTILYCELLGEEFIYSPFNAMQHNYTDDIDFLEKKERLINITSEYKTGIAPYAPYSIYREVEKNLDKCLNGESIKRIKKAFFVKKNSPYTEPSIAIHIRRRNINDNVEQESENYYSDNCYFVDAINRLRKHGFKFHIFSQGEEKDFKDFISTDTILHLNESLESTFCGLVFADILVMSKSSLSYSAALISNGEIYYQPFWHPSSEKWKVFS